MALWLNSWFGGGGRVPDPATNGQPSGPNRIPTTHEEWVQRYSWLHDAYVGGPYSVGDMKALGLFRALDPDGDVILETRRLTRDVQHVVDTGAQALWGATPAIDLMPGMAGTPADLETAARVWRRSRVTEQKERWSRWGASMGDVVLEAARLNTAPPYDVRIVGYDPRVCEVEYDDATGCEIARVVITQPYLDMPDAGPRGTAGGMGVLHEYVRILDRESVTVYRDGVLVPEESGPHLLGVVPAVHLSWLPYVDPSHGLWTAVGLEQPLALIDSLLTQVQAIGVRHANPLLAISGAKIASGAGVFDFGRVLSGLPADGKAEYLEASLQGVAQLLEAANVARQQARDTLPEFLFTQAGASASGAALNFWAAAFVAKMESIRGRWSPGLARVTEYAVRMEQGSAYDPDDALYRVQAPPVLPVNVEGEVKVLHDVLERGGIRLIDYVRGLQRIGVLGAEVDPEEYAAALVIEREANEERTRATMAATFGPAREPEPEPEPDDTDTDTDTGDDDAGEGA